MKRALTRNLTRIDIVDQNGVHEFWGDGWDVDIQDGGQTLKLFQKDGYGAAAKARRDVALAMELSAASIKDEHHA